MVSKLSLGSPQGRTGMGTAACALRAQVVTGMPACGVNPYSGSTLGTPFPPENELLGSHPDSYSTSSLTKFVSKQRGLSQFCLSQAISILLTLLLPYGM